MVKYSVKFNLFKRTASDGTQPVRMRVSWMGNRYDQFLPLSIESKYWDEKSAVVKNTYRPNGDLSAASKANAIVSDAKSLADRFFARCDIEDALPTMAALKEWLNPARDIHKESPKMWLFSDVVEEFLQENAVSRSWSKSLKVLMRHMANLLLHYAPHARLGEVDENFILGFTDFLYKRGYRNTTVRKRYQYLRWILSWCASKGYPVSKSALDFELKFKGVSPAFLEVVYLTWDEMMKLKDCPFLKNKRLEKTRDVFLFCCFSGLRYSDVASLKRSDIQDGRIRVITKKTSKAIDIELNKYTREILAKYEDMDFNGKALPVTHLESYNQALKKMAQVAGVDAPTKLVHYVKSDRREVIKPKYEVITSHCARRSFVVNALRLGIPAEVIMSWTGHSDFESMRPYVKIVDDLKSDQMAKFNVDASDTTTDMANDAPASAVGGRPSSEQEWRKKILMTEGLSELLTEDLLATMSVVETNGLSSFKEICREMNLPSTTVRKRLNILRSNGFLKTEGSGNSIYWCLCD